jgi:ubiquinone biosynthesis protein UbiJ
VTSDDAEVERLRRKVEQLEQRVRELEGGRPPAP